MISSPEDESLWKVGVVRFWVLHYELLVLLGGFVGWFWSFLELCFIAAGIGEEAWFPLLAGWSSWLRLGVDRVRVGVGGWDGRFCFEDTGALQTDWAMYS